VQWARDGVHVISFEDNQWLVWDTRTGRATLTLPVTQNAQNQDTTSNDYRYIALSNRGNIVQIWDTTTGREVLDYRGHAANVRVLATGWEPDNRHVASLGSDGRLLIWDALTGKTLENALLLPGQLATHTGAVMVTRRPNDNACGPTNSIHGERTAFHKGAPGRVVSELRTQKFTKTP
jgi:WD40 repeat protein